MPTDRSTTTRPPGDRALGSATVRRRAGVLLAAIVATLLGCVGLSAPASAHGGDIVISLGTDGRGGISATLTYKNDGHPVEQSADVTVTAESEDGETVGPVGLMSASEGVGWYVSDPEVLSEGHWVLSATTTEPTEAQATAEVDVLAVEDAPADAQEGTDAQAGTDGSAAGDGSSSTPWWIVGIVVVVGAAAAAVVVLVRRRSTTSTSRSGR